MWAKKSLLEPYTLVWGDLHLISAMGHLNRNIEAIDAISNLHHTRPDLNISKIEKSSFMVDKNNNSYLLDGLKKPGCQKNNVCFWLKADVSVAEEKRLLYHQQRTSFRLRGNVCF
jgi:hypothetical protein